MAYIYQITNNINGKIYVGKTTKNNIQERWKEHLKDYKKPRCEKRPLYDAINKYGSENFSIKELEECSAEEASEKEIYWIEKLSSFKYGYNATKGGDGKTKYDHQKILEALRINPRPIEIAKLFNCSCDLVQQIAKEHQIQIINQSNEQMKKEKSKSIRQYDKNGILINTFNSVAEAGQWCFENKKCLNYNSGVRSHIAECANGKRKTAYGYIWKYI